VLILWPDDMLWYKCRIVGYRRRPKRREDRKNEDGKNEDGKNEDGKNEDGKNEGRKNEDGGENEHRVIYDDGEVRWHNLSQERYAPLSWPYFCCTRCTFCFVG
jgi:hypothetical protein